MNYEKLGIYTEAVEKFAQNRHKRSFLALEITNILKNIAHEDNYNAHELDLNKFEITIKEFLKADEKMLKYKDIANSIHEEIDKPKIKLNKW